ncbi:hypothetical protein ebA7208 [Aromatoleum aromaticum EbN1]|uniref:Uncharacterized protein n=1 Tax=Aromatoleum aromaticum (strain DSM 19018 / LMG 30748 / EbN1) TaxID=76114 RepID=Q5NXK3_AROAE|nr:hypothetical protein ebA7208 [Aromatoleum aromaticum EbN1]
MPRALGLIHGEQAADRRPGCDVATTPPAKACDHAVSNRGTLVRYRRRERRKSSCAPFSAWHVWPSNALLGNRSRNLVWSRRLKRSGSFSSGTCLPPSAGSRFRPGCLCAAAPVQDCAALLAAGGVRHAQQHCDIGARRARNPGIPSENSRRPDQAPDIRSRALAQRDDASSQPAFAGSAIRVSELLSGHESQGNCT